MKVCWELFDGAEDLELLMGEWVIGLILLRGNPLGKERGSYSVPVPNGTIRFLTTNRLFCALLMIDQRQRMFAHVVRLLPIRPINDSTT